MKTYLIPRLVFLSLSVIVLLAVNSCNKDKDENLSAFDLTGNWDYYGQREDEAHESGPYLMTIVQTGDELEINIPAFDVQGVAQVKNNKFYGEMNDSENNNTIYSVGTIEDEDHISGTWSEDGPYTGTWRLVRIGAE